MGGGGLHAQLSIWVDGEERRSYILRPGQSFVLGRGAGTSILIDDKRVSRKHAELSLGIDGLTVLDLGSRNGTFLDQKRLPANERTRVFPDSVIQLGKHEVRPELFGFDEESKTRTMEQLALDAPLLPKEEFEILEEVGSGAVGRVWVAHQKLLDRMVAVKFLRWELDPDAQEQRRFLQEARVCAGIKSPHVVSVYDIRISDGRPIIIMELVQGSTARDLFAGGPIRIPEALLIAEEVARGLAAAAAVGVVHRDVKPSNILIGPDGVAKLGDFGIAKDTTASALTETGLGLGSLPYAAPEQVLEAKSVDGRSDVYGLGATLYHLITGRPPLGSLDAGLLEMVEAITHEKPKAPSVFREDCPLEVDTLLLRMLEKSRSARPQTAAEVAAALADVRERCYPRYRRGPVVSDPLSESQDEDLEG